MPDYARSPTAEIQVASLRRDVLHGLAGSLMFACVPTVAVAETRASKGRRAFATSSTATDSAFRSDLEAFLDKGLARFPAIPALSMAIVHDEHAVVITARGWANRAAGLRASNDTRFYIASSTKSFVALALTRLDEKNDVDLDWTLAELAPDIRFADGTQPEKVSLRHLLSHSHGLKGDAMQFRLAYSGEWDEATLWRLLGSLTPNPKAPLGTFAYSNLGYNVAALLVERRLQQSWQRIVEREVIAPLRLLDTATRGLARPADRALPYDGTQQLYLRKSDATMQSAGGMESSAHDMARWVAANLAAERGRTAGLSAAMRATHAALVPANGSYGPFARTHYGLGWYSGPYESQQLFHSFGGFTGFRAHASFMPAQNLGVAAMSNDDGAGFWFVDIAAAYAYDWYGVGPHGAESRAEARMAELESRLSKAAVSSAPSAPSPLLLSAKLYAGRYCHADWGTVFVAHHGQNLSVRMGALRAILVGAGDNAFYAELVPGQRTRLSFRIMNGRVEGLEAFGVTFRAGGRANPASRSSSDDR